MMEYQSDVYVIIYNYTGDYAIKLDNNNPVGYMGSGAHWCVELYNGSPNGTYYVSISSSEGYGYNGEIVGPSGSACYETSTPFTNYTITITGPGINGQFIVYGGVNNVSPLYTYWTPTPVPATPTPVGPYLVVHQIINEMYGQEVVVDLNNPQAIIPYAGQFYLQLFNAQPNSTYLIQLYLPGSSTPYVEFTGETDNYGWYEMEINSPASNQFAIVVTGPLLTQPFIVYVGGEFPLSISTSSTTISTIGAVTPAITTTPTTTNYGVIALILLAAGGAAGLGYYLARRK